MKLTKYPLKPTPPIISATQFARNITVVFLVCTGTHALPAAVRQESLEQGRHQKTETFNARIFSNPNAKTLVIGRDTRNHLQPHAERQSKLGNPTTTYLGPSEFLRTRISQSAEKQSAQAIARLEKDARKKGQKLSSKKLAEFKKQFMSEYRRQRYLAHNIKAIQYATKKGIKIIDLGHSSNEKTRSTFLSAERKSILDSRCTNYKAPPRTNWFKRKH